MRLRISDEARRDLRELHLYGTRTYGHRPADVYIGAMTLALQQLVDWPLANRLRTDVRPPVRLLAYAAHNVFYDVHDDEVTIVRVLHHSADWVHIL